MPCKLPFLFRGWSRWTGWFGFIVVDDLLSLVLLFTLFFNGALQWSSIEVLVPLAVLQISRLIFLRCSLAFTRPSAQLRNHAGLRRLQLILIVVSLAVMLTGFLWNRDSPFVVLFFRATVSLLHTSVYMVLLWYADERTEEDPQRVDKAESNAVLLARLERLTLRAFSARLDDSKDRPICSICLSEFELDEALLQLKCGHTYHESCMVQWLRHGGRRCPLRCKATLASPALVIENPLTITV